MEVINVYAATANPLKVPMYDDGSESGSIIGVIDRKKPLGAEKNTDKEKRHVFIKKYVISDDMCYDYN